MLLADFYHMFPEYDRNRFHLRFVRNELYLSLDYKIGRTLVIDYFDDQKIYLIIKDAALRTTMKTRQKLRNNYGMSFDKENNPMYLTTSSNLKKDANKFMRLIEQLETQKIVA